MKSFEFEGIRIKWLGHDSFRLDFKDKIIYIDPFEIKEKEKATVVMITHAHYDHFSPGDIKRISDEKTWVVGTKEVVEKIDLKNKLLVSPGTELKVEGIKIKAVPAYNLNKPFHPKSNLWVGYLFEINGVTFYHAGDTDFIPEMKDISADVAFLPVSGTYVMNPEEAVAAARKIMPKIAIPMHYGKIVGTNEDALKFKELCDFCRVEIL